MTRLIAILLVLAFAAALSSAATARADDHENDLLDHDLERKRQDKGNKAGGALLALFQEYQEYVEREGTSDGFEPSNPLIRLVEDRVIIEAVANGNADDLDADLKGLGLGKGKKGAGWCPASCP